MGDAVREAKAHLSLSRFEDQRPRTVATSEELALTEPFYGRGRGVGHSLGDGLPLRVGVGLCADTAQYFPPVFND